VTRAMEVLETDTSNVPRELNQMIDAVRRPDGSDRAFWGLRSFRVAVAVKARDRFGDSCVPPWLRPTIYGNLLGDDPTSAAAHRLELPLLVLAVRIITQPAGRLRAEIREWLARLDPEARLTLGRVASEHSFALDAALLQCRLIWNNLHPWNAETLHNIATEVRALLQGTTYDRSFVHQYVGQSFGDDWEDSDPLVDYTIIALAESSVRLDLTPEEQEIVRARADGTGPVAASARKLIA
jgi:hypothetical protein